jgi:predicted transcriptional regulator of viral defense system
MNLDEYIRRLESKNIYFFTREEAEDLLGISGTAFNSAVRRRIDKGKVTNLRKGFYLVIPPRYQLLGIVPVQLYIDQLFRWLDRPYYISLLSAAEHHGSSHQALQKSYVITNAPALRKIEKPPYRIAFFVKTHWPDKNIVIKSSDAGTFKVSSIALTLVDLINYQNKIGGMNRIIHTIEELIEDLLGSDLQDLISWYPDVSDLQRLGFLMERLGAEVKLLTIMEEWVSNQQLNTILLTPGMPWNTQSISNKWRVNVNNELEF